MSYFHPVYNLRSLIDFLYYLVDDGICLQVSRAGLFTLHRFQIDIIIFLEKDLARLDGKKCSHIWVASSGPDEYVSRICSFLRGSSSRFPCKSEDNLQQNRARANHFQVRLEEDPFLNVPDPDPIDGRRQEALRAAVDFMMKTEQGNSLSETDSLYHGQAATDLTDVLHASFCAKSPVSTPCCRLSSHVMASLSEYDCAATPMNSLLSLWK